MNNEEKILSLLTELKDGQVTTNARLEKIEADVSELRADVGEIMIDVSELKVGQAKLEAGQKTIRKAIRNLKDNLHYVGLISDYQRKRITALEERPAMR